MPTYQVLIDGLEIEQFVTQSSYAAAYQEIAARFPLIFLARVLLEEIDPGRGNG